MKAHYKYASIFLLLFIGIKLTFLAIGKQMEWFHGIIFVNVLMVLLVVFFTIVVNSKNNNDEETLFYDVKKGMRSAAIYAILLSLFIYCYYRWIDPGFLQTMQDQFMESALTAVNNNTIPNNMTPQKFMSESATRVQTMYSPFTQSTYTMAGSLMLGFLYSILLSVLNRKVLNRFK